MFNFIDIYSFNPVNGCVSRTPSALLCPEAYNTVKTTLEQMFGWFPPETLVSYSSNFIAMIKLN